MRLNIFWSFSAKEEAASTLVKMPRCWKPHVGLKYCSINLISIRMAKNTTDLNFNHSKLKRIQIALKRFWTCAMIYANMVHTIGEDTNLIVTVEFDSFKFNTVCLGIKPSINEYICFHCYIVSILCLSFSKPNLYTDMSFKLRAVLLMEIICFQGRQLSLLGVALQNKEGNSL